MSDEAMNNFTPRAQQVLALARKEADRFNHNFVGTEHLLLGLIKLGQGVAVNVLQKLGLDLETVRMEVEKQVGTGPDQKMIGNIPYTPRVKKVLALAAKEAKALNHTYVGTEHILLGLLREGDGVAARVLKNLDVDIEQTRQEILKELDPNFAAQEEGVSGESSSEKPAQEKKGEIKTPALKAFGRDLTEIARKGEMDPVIGRKNEIERVIQILCRRTKNNPVLLGEAGVGKTAIVEGLAQEIAAGNVPELLRDKRVITLDLALMVAGTKYRGQFDKAIEASVKHSDRYITDRYLPDKAIDLMDEAGSRARIGTMTRPPEVKDLEADIEDIKSKKERAIKNQDFEGAASMRDKEKHAKEKLESVLKEWRTTREEKRVKVDEEDILHVVAKWTGIPLQRMEQGEMARLLQVEGEMGKVVIGQREAVSALCKAFRRSRADLKDPRRPIGTFALLGPTGVGKTLLAKTLAEQLFGDSKSLIQLDMSEYMEKFNVSRLIGSPPGYVGYEEGGQLTEQVRRKPYSVVLFDEIEKAHPDVWNLLLQILEEGKLTDNVGRVVNFRNTIILMTSNVGSDTIKRQSTLGFSPITDESSYERMREKILEESKKTFRPEFLNRLDDVIVFRSFTKADLIQILDLEIKKVLERLKGRNFKLDLDEKAMDFLVEKGYDPVYGARPMRRAVERFFEDPLAEEILKGSFHEGEPIQVSAEGDHLTFSQKATAEGALSS